MTLTFGCSPFGPQRGSYNVGALPDHIAYAEPWPRRMRATFGNRTVLDSRNGIMLHRTGTAPTLLFPLADLTAPALAGPAGADIEGLVIIDYSAMDRWFEEDDPVYAHPRDPYHRVVSARRRGMSWYGTRAWWSRSPGGPSCFSRPACRYGTTCHSLTSGSTCSSSAARSRSGPYKGDGQHWNLAGASDVVADAAWSLPHPLAEASLALEHIGFYPDKLEVMVDQEHVM